jgi:hypothetical protein
MAYNILNCAGWETTGFMTFGPCMKARLGLVFLFFIIALIRKWGGEEMGIGFSFLFALILGIVPYLIIITIFGSMKLAFLIGIVGSLIGGYLMGGFVGE